MDSVLGRCGASNVAVLSRDQVEKALSVCSGDEEEAVACLVKSSFLHNVYAGDDHFPDDETHQLRSARLNQELSTLLKDDSLPRDVSCYECNNPLTSNRHHLSYDDCLENKGRLQDCSCSIGSYHCIQCYAHIL